MALTYGFYNSIEGDRVYDAIQFGRIFDGIIKDGVYATYEKGMMVIASSNPAEVIIQPGRAWFNHTWSYNDANVIFEAPAPEVLLERIDALVLEINEELSARENSFKWVTGTPSSRPERPALTNTSTIHQYPLCYVHRYPETTMIYTRDITNMIGTSECPFVTGVLEGIDLDAWINQWDDEFHTWENSKKTQFEAWMLSQETAFTTWYNAFKDQMASDVQEVEDFVDYLESVLDASTAIHLQEEIDDLRDEISSGSHITVTTINPELYGRNVTITESGGTVFTEKFDNTGVAEFKSVPYVGNLTISSTYGQQTAERVVNTPYYARYEFAIAFWAATVNIIGDPEMSGSSVTVKDSEEAIVGTVVLDSEGTGVYTAIKPDTYKFILTYGGETMEVTLSVTQETTYTVDLHADRFKWENWVDASKTLHSTDYNSLDEVLADEEAVRELMTVHACVDYLANIDEEDEDVKTIIENDLVAKWANLRDYALDTLYANEAIADYMDHSHKELKGQVPVMTSNTTPSGEAIMSAVQSTNYAYYAFDNNSSSYANTQAAAGSAYIGYTFTRPVIVTGMYYKSKGDGWNCISGKVQGYDGTDWIDITNAITFASGEVAAAVNKYVSFENNTPYYGYRLLAISKDTNFSATELQFYAYEYSSKYFLGEWALMPQVPKMTSNTAPYGEVIKDSERSSFEAYKVFDNSISTGWASSKVKAQASEAYIGYKFPAFTKVKQFSIRWSNWTECQYKLWGSVDGITFDLDLGTYTDSGSVMNGSGVSALITHEVSTPQSCLAYKIQFISQTGSENSYAGNICILQFYAWAPKGNVPVMTSNTAPYGTVSATSEASGVGAYRIFDGDLTTQASFASNIKTGFIQYKFTNPINVRMVAFYINAQPFTTTFKLSYSDDGSSFTDTQETYSVVNGKINTFNVEDCGYHLYWRFTRTVSDSGQQFVGLMLQFYGRELSVSVPVMTGDVIPYGESKCGGTNTNPWKAFDSDKNSFADVSVGSSGNVADAWFQYKFTSPNCVKMIKVREYNNSNTYKMYTFKLQYSNDAVTWTDITSSDYDATNKSFDTDYMYKVDNDVPALYWRLQAITAKNSYRVLISDLQFYGLDYSEREFETGATKKWMYDHGVELETLTAKTIGSGIARKDMGCLHVEVPNSTNQQATFLATLDLTPYEISRMKLRNGYVSTSGGAQCFAPGIFNTTTPDVTTSMVGSLRVGAADGNFENNFGLDVSSFDASYTIGIYTSNGSSGQAARSQDCMEWWLE